MKYLIFCLLSLLALPCKLIAQSESIGIGINSPHPSSVLHIHSSSANQGFLIPSSAPNEIVGITNFADGLTFYDSITNRFSYMKNEEWKYINPWDTEIIQSNGVEYINTNFKVGIRTTEEPVSELEVNGVFEASKFAGLGIVPLGGIIMWSGDTIPDGYELCDGTPPTPNLMDRFIYAGGIEDIDHIGGENSTSLSEINYGEISGEETTTAVTSSENRPLYYQLAFIMRVD